MRTCSSQENEAAMAMAPRSNRATCFLSLPSPATITRILCFIVAFFACGLSAYALLLLSDYSPSFSKYLYLLDVHDSSTTSLPPASSPAAVSCFNRSLLLPAESSRSLRHNWSDEELIRRTVEAEKRNSAFFSSKLASAKASCLRRRHFHLAEAAGDENKKKPWKVAFLFLTRGPLPFAPLWERFFRGHEAFFNIYVHLDPFDVEAFEIDSSADNVFCGRLIPSFRTERGAPSLAAASRRLLANALLDDPLNLYFAILSDHCIPLRSFRGVYDHLLRQAEGKSFIEILSNEPTLAGRYESRGGESAMLPEVPLQRFRVGSQFFVLNRDHAMSVVADEKIWSKFKKPCSDINNCYTEEHYFPTFVGMEVKDAVKCVEPRTLTHVQWFFPNDGHPRTFSGEQVNEDLIATLRRNDSFLFARKFSDDSLLPLLQLSSFIFQEGNAV